MVVGSCAALVSECAAVPWWSTARCPEVSRQVSRQAVRR